MVEIAFDIETTGLNPWAPVTDENPLGGKVLLVTIATQDKKIIQYTGDDKKGIMGLKPILEDPKVIKLIHRSSFDATWMAVHYGIYIKNIFDTKLAETIILGQGEYGKTGLRDTLVRYGLAKLDKTITESFINKADYNFTPKQLKYAVDDVKHMIKLKKLQLEKIALMGLEELVQLENNVAEVTYRMRVHGINFDLKHWSDTASTYEKQYKHLEGVLNKLTTNIVTKKRFNKMQVDLFEPTTTTDVTTIGTKWSSPAQVKKLFNINSFDDLQKGVSKEMDAFIEMHGLSKYLTTYGMGWLNNERGPTVAADGRVHTDFSQIVSTGRYASSFPNMQNIMKDTPHRQAFIPTKGYTLVSGDFTGQELGIMAFGSQEESWLTAMRKGQDVHSIMASKIMPGWDQAGLKTCTFPFKCKCPKNLDLREKAKVFNFGLPYGKGAFTLALDLSVSQTAAANFILHFKRSAPKLARWLDTNGKQAVRNFFARTLPPYNRYRDLSQSPKDYHRRNQGYNTPVQGSGGDILKLALWNVYLASTSFKEFRDVKILLCVHDEVVTECPTPVVKKWAAAMKMCMEAAADYVTEKGLIKVDILIEKRWSELKK